MGIGEGDPARALVRGPFEVGKCATGNPDLLRYPLLTEMATVTFTNQLVS
jgi:hypothetical protein